MIIFSAMNKGRNARSPGVMFPSKENSITRRLRSLPQISLSLIPHLTLLHDGSPHIEYIVSQHSILCILLGSHSLADVVLLNLLRSSTKRRAIGLHQASGPRRDGLASFDARPHSRGTHLVCRTTTMRPECRRVQPPMHHSQIFSVRSSCVLRPLHFFRRKGNPGQVRHSQQTQRCILLPPLHQQRTFFTSLRSSRAAPSIHRQVAKAILRRPG
jgi:hypothetical protein